MPVSGPDCKWRWRSSGGGAMERRSRAVLFCIEEEQGRAEAARCGEDRRIKHWSFKGNCVIREMSFLAVLSILKHILVSFNIYIYAYSRKQSFPSPLRSRGCNFQVPYSKASFLFFNSKALYIYNMYVL